MYEVGLVSATSANSFEIPSTLEHKQKPFSSCHKRVVFWEDLLLGSNCFSFLCLCSATAALKLER